MMRAVQLEGRLFYAAVAAVAAFCLVFAYLPMVDLPQHYAMVSIFTHYHDPAYGFEARYTFDLLGRPYATVYVLGAGLAKIMPLGAAMRIVVAACTVAPVLGARALLAATGRPRMWALLAVPFSFGSVWFWGFLNFLAGTGMFLAGLALVVTSARTGSRRAAVALGVLAIALLFTHVHGLFMLLALAPLFAWGWCRDGDSWRATLRGVFRTVLPLAPAAIAAAVFILSTWRQAVGAWPAIDPGIGERIERFPEFLAAGLPAPWPLLSVLAIAGIAVVALLVRDRAQATARRQRIALGGALASQILLYVVLPLNTSTATYVSARHALLIVLLFLPVLPHVRRPGIALAAASAFALAGLVDAGVHFARFNSEAHEIDPILDAMKPNRRVASLIFENGSAHVHSATFPYLHFAGYYQAANGGDLARSFAVVWNVPVRYRDDYARYAISDDIEWQPGLFSPSEDLPHYDYVLVRGRNFRPPPPESGLIVVARSGPWTLVENPRALPP